MTELSSPPVQEQSPAHATHPKLKLSEIRVAHEANGTIACPFCGGTRYRRSRLNGFGDYMELLMLRYPVRCMNCNQRQYSYLLTASLAHAAKNYR